MTEQDYSKPLHGYRNLDQRNHDGSNPHGEARDMVDITLDFVAVVLVLAVLTFIVFGVAGFVSSL